MLERLYELLDACDSHDVEYHMVGGELQITVQDFDGFDDDWSELDHEYVDYEAVEAVEDYLDEACDDYESYCTAVYYHFGDEVVCLTYASADI